MQKYFYLILFLMVLTIKSKAQSTRIENNSMDINSIGLGFGQDYGGLGVNGLHYFNRNFGLFGGIGYAIAGLGLNAGIKVRIVKRNTAPKVYPILLAMYGYNAAVAVINDSQYNKIFYGPTFGIGLEVRRKITSKGYWSFTLQFPIRSAKVDAYFDDLEQNHGIEFSSRLLPISFSIGYRFIIH